jgi:hypothetical protein
MGKHDTKSDDATPDDAEARDVKTEMVPLSTMFRFYEPVDMALLAAGALFSALAERFSRPSTWRSGTCSIRRRWGTWDRRLTTR